MRASPKDTARETGPSCVLDLGKDRITDEGMERSSYDEIDLVVETGFKVFRKIHQLPSDGTAEFHDDVDIALRGCFPAGMGSEYANGCYTVVFPDLRKAVFQYCPYLISRFHGSDTR